jgi:hypothetical protein
LIIVTDRAIIGGLIGPGELTASLSARVSTARGDGRTRRLGLRYGGVGRERRGVQMCLVVIENMNGGPLR